MGFRMLLRVASRSHNIKSQGKGSVAKGVKNITNCIQDILDAQSERPQL